MQAVDLVADPATTRGLFESATVGGRASEDSTDDKTTAADTLHGIADADKIDLPRPQASAIPLSTLEGTDGQASQLRAERDALAAKVRRLQEEILRHERRDLIRKLLIEHELPYPDDGYATSAATLVSRAFLESLMAADNESTVRELVSARQSGGGGAVNNPQRRPTALADGDDRDRANSNTPATPRPSRTPKNSSARLPERIRRSPRGFGGKVITD